MNRDHEGMEIVDLVGAVNKNLYLDLLEFVKKSTSHFDDSHNWKHAVQVTTNSFLISRSDQCNNLDYSKLLILSMLHDVCDHKYKELSISDQQLLDYIQSMTNDQNETNIIMNIIDSVSYSKQVKGTTYEGQLNDKDKELLYILRDADRIEAIGLQGIERCRIYTKQMYPSMNDTEIEKLVIEHCHEKLLKLYRDHFIVTEKGREIAYPLHVEIENYIEKSKCM